MQKEIAKFIKRSVLWLCLNQEGCCRYTLDDHLAIYVGWTSGYGKKRRDDVIQAKDDLDWGINVGIKVHTSDYMQTDYDWLNFPYYESGDVIDMGVAVARKENYNQLAGVMLKMYDDVKHLNINDDGKILYKL